MNLANKITIFRILLVPLFMIILFSNIGNATYIAGIIFIIASITDAIDGHLARSKNMITDFGKFMDPLADKILVLAALISLVQFGKVPAWMVVIVITREFTVTGLRILAAASGVTIAASNLGKFKTIFQLLAIILLLFNNYPFDKMNLPMDYILLHISVIFTIISGIDYIYKNKEIFQKMDM